MKGCGTPTKASGTLTFAGSDNAFIEAGDRSRLSIVLDGSYGTAGPIYAHTDGSKSPSSASFDLVFNGATGQFGYTWEENPPSGRIIFSADTGITARIGWSAG